MDGVYKGYGAMEGCCKNTAGTQCTDYWCMDCDTERREAITKNLTKNLKELTRGQKTNFYKENNLLPFIQAQREARKEDMIPEEAATFAGEVMAKRKSFDAKQLEILELFRHHITNLDKEILQLNNEINHLKLLREERQQVRARAIDCLEIHERQKTND